MEGQAGVMRAAAKRLASGKLRAVGGVWMCPAQRFQLQSQSRTHLSLAVMGVSGAQALCMLMQFWPCLQLISTIESIPVLFCISKQGGWCAGGRLWTLTVLGVAAESFMSCVPPQLLTPLCFNRTKMEPSRLQSCRTSSVSSPACPGAPSSTTRYAPLIKACFPCMDSSASGRKRSPSPLPLVTPLCPC